EVRGNREIGDAEIRRIIGLTEGSELIRETLDELIEGASDAYGELGYEHVRIVVVVRDTDDPSRKVLRLEIQEGEPTRISRVQFEGTAPPEESGAGESLEFGVGDILDRDVISNSVRAAETEMRGEGWFEARLGPAVMEEASGTGVMVSIPSRPGPHYEVRYRGLAPLRRGDIEDILELGEDPLTDAVVEGIRERVVDLYQRNGFYDARASVTRRAGRQPGSAYLDVSVVPGSVLKVTQISFPGAQFLDEAHLRNEVESYLDEDLPRAEPLEPVDGAIVDEIGFGGTSGRRTSPAPHEPNPHRVYYEPTYEAAIERLVELYAVMGFLSAQVGPARMERTEQNRARVEVPVQEGPRTMLQRVDIDGNAAVTTRQILITSELSRGQPFSRLALEEARIRIVEAYRERGFLFARVEPTVAFSEDRTRAEVRITVVEAFAVRVGRVIIEGADNTSENLIRDRVVLEVGELYRPSLARESQRRLLEIGVFSGVNIGVADPDLPAQVKDVVVTVAERKPQYLDFTAGFSTGQGLRGGFEYGYRNLFGYGVTTTLRVQLGFQFIFVDPVLEERYEALSVQDRLERNVAIGMLVPHIRGLANVRSGNNLYHRRDNERDFGLDENGGSITASWRALKRLALSGGVNLENSNVQLFTGENLNDYLMMNMDPRLDRLLRVPEGESTIFAVPLTLALDLRDNPFDPTQGFFGSISAEYAVTLDAEPQGPDMVPFESNFVKLTFTTSGYIPVVGKTVFAVQVRGGRIFHTNDASRTYPNRSYYMGGVETMRGYYQDAMMPQDLATAVAADPDLDDNDVVRAGDTFVLIRGELRFPIWGSLYGGVFTDLGNLWAEPRFFDLFTLRATAGLGLRLKTPVGPLALDYGFVLDRREELGEPIGTLHFSIGLF
ncbi:MAG: hypothetical protein DRJ42_26245, partial [Deltaproteobacteria bacterium]